MIAEGDFVHVVFALIKRIAIVRLFYLNEEKVDIRT